MGSNLYWTAIIIFIVSYAGVAFGRIPGLQLDRVGIALLGAIAMMVMTIVPLNQIIYAIDLPTLMLLYSLMIISAQLRLGGFYTFVAVRVMHLSGQPRRLLALVMLLSAVFSALLANDIICLAFTPVLVYSLIHSKINPIPFLLGLAISSNLGSAATIIGNPQNMLIGQVGRLHFDQFIVWCAPPAIVSLVIGYFIILFFYRDRFAFDQGIKDLDFLGAWPPFNRWQSMKGLIAVSLMLVLFFMPIPREISAMVFAGILLCSRKMESREIMSLIDWNLLILFIALFIIIHGISLQQIPQVIVNSMEKSGFNLHNLYFLGFVSTLLSNLVSNVPATMLLIKFLEPQNHEQWYVLAASSTFAGNLITIGSIANLIVFEQAKRFGISIGFWEHARIGIPITVVSLLILFAWILVMSI
ncbi:MAG: anion transporter [Calditrichaeota bacterium]|nr:MAG: anion transporter [Calditrichota bacterium]